MRYAYTFRSYSTATVKSRVLQWRERFVDSLYSEKDLVEKNLVD